MPRPEPTVRIESVQGGDFSIVVDRVTQFEITQDLTAPSEARFELGDDGSWSAIKPALATGARFAIYVNNTPRLKGRLLAKNLPISVNGGATVQVTVRTLLADAFYSSAEEFNLRKASLKDAILAAYEPLGVKESDFIFVADVNRDLLTGYRGRARGTKPPVDLAPIKEEDARVHPPETIREFVERHLNRYHLTHWDAGDGRIVVGAPDDTQLPLFNFRLRWGINGRANNLLEAQKLEDYEDVPVDLWVYGEGGGKGITKAKVQWLEVDPVLAGVSPGLFRRAVVIDNGIKTQSLAEARARREMSARSRMRDAWRLTYEGLSYWDGRHIGFGVDTVCDVTIDAYGGASGAYLIYRITQGGNADEGYKTVLDTVAKGVWRL